MATVGPVSLDDDNPLVGPLRRGPSNFDVQFASLRNADLLNIAEAGTRPARALNKGHIRATVRHRKELKNSTKDVSFALLLASDTPKKQRTLFGSQDNMESHEFKRLECIFPGSTKKLPNVGDVIELALNSPAILESTRTASFPFKLRFETVIMRIISMATNEVGTREIGPKGLISAIQGSSSAVINHKMSNIPPSVLGNSALSVLQKEAPPPLVAVEKSTPLNPRVKQYYMDTGSKAHRPNIAPADVSTIRPVQTELTKKSSSHKGFTKKDRYRLEKTAEDALRRGQKRLQIEQQNRISHQKGVSDGNNAPLSSLLPPSKADESIPRRKLAKQVVKAFSKPLSSTAIPEADELTPKSISSNDQQPMGHDDRLPRIPDDQIMENSLTVEMLLAQGEEISMKKAIESTYEDKFDMVESLEHPENSMQAATDETMADASQIENPDDMVFMVQMGDEPPDIPADDSTKDDKDDKDDENDNDTFGLGSKGFVSQNGRFSCLRQLQACGKGAKINLITMVQAQGEMKLSRGDCWMRSYEVFDHSIGSTEVVKMNLFFSKKSWVPDLTKDQIILIRNAKVDVFNKRKTLTGYKGDFTWIAYDPESSREFFSDVPEEDRRGAPITEPNEQEIEYIHSLISWWRNKLSVQETYRPTRKFFTKHKLLSEFGAHTPFIDATVELVFKNDNDRFMELGVSDYTKNDEFKDFVKRGVPGRQMTLSLFVFPNEGAFETAKMLNVGKYYRVKNMKVDVYEGQLQAKMGWQGDFFMLSERDTDGNPELRRLLERKAAFERRDESMEVEISPVKEVRYGNPKHSVAAHISDGPVPIQGPSSSKTLICKSTAPFRSFSELSSIYRPIESKIRARIIEFLPRDHQDMVIVRCTKCQSYQRGKDIQQSQCPGCQSSIYRAYELQFAMLMADEDDDYITVKVAGDEGLKLFGLGPIDFGKEPLDTASIVKQVEAQLSAIVGNLWQLMGTQHFLFQAGQFDVVALARLVESPWIDIGIRSWFLKDEEGLWTQQYGLCHCSFE